VDEKDLTPPEGERPQPPEDFGDQFEQDFTQAGPAPSEEDRPPRQISEVPSPENITPEDVPDPYKGDEVDEEALKANEKYHLLDELIYAGRLSKHAEFLPGRFVRLHTPDTGEVIAYGKIMDEEFGKLTPAAGISASYDDGIKEVMLSIVIDDLDNTAVFTPASDFENPMNPALNRGDRQLAIMRKSDAVRGSKLQFYVPWVQDCIYHVYRELLAEQEAALRLLPFYSRAGQRLPDSSPWLDRARSMGLIPESTRSS
jgi:hypothetical protein